ncbi:helix-turn-helix domain-containing protein [Sinorhizobium sp. 7-81]|uniref:helix-turn-helix domain-containing protein n=1 Tax=Sinorhizobium sp. 8-89 TaxID=3049089 RepID=UPI0024C2F9A4|nr:helix-turn-helix domain-containing protein [Sinorhizobium sp. 8-89]MDK1491427.1 helix-turn-helix domain-containing protein [Sinorhizobium sp. 8-89]
MHTSVMTSSGRRLIVAPTGPRTQGEVEARPTSSFVDGESIYHSGERAGRAYRVEFGAVRVYRVLANGRRQILAFHFGGNWFGLQNEDRHRSTAEAIGITGVKSITLTEDLHTWQGLLPAVLESFLSAQEHQLVIGRQSAVERVAAFLVEMSDRSGHSHRFELFMPRVDVADYLGLTIETVSRSLTKLKNKGVIRLHGARGIEIVDYRALQNLCL